MLVWVGAVSPALTSAMIKELRQQRFDPRPAAANASIAAASWVDYQNTTVMESAWLQKQAVLREAAARARSTRRSAWPVVHHVTYASGCCATILQKNHDAAVQHGALTSLALGPADLNPTWYLENDAVLRSKRGAGYWLWKPRVILEALERAEWDEVVLYMDSGSLLQKPPHGLARWAMNGSGFMHWCSPHLERVWCKRDAFVLLGLPFPDTENQAQRTAAFVLVRKTQANLKFVHEWLRLAQDIRVVSDMPSTTGPEDRAFRSHRHDQAILSLLAKRRGLPCYRDPSQWGGWSTPSSDQALYPGDYGQVIVHTRQKA